MTEFKKRRLAVIDVGTNSILLLVAERDEKGTLTVIKDRLATPRLGAGLRETGKISDEALERTHDALQMFSRTAKDLSPEKVLIATTSAVREANNQPEVLSRLEAGAEGEIEVLSRNDEARLSYVAVTSVLNHDLPSMVVDIGGGSTEITWGIGSRFDGGRSLNLGTVKLLEGPLSMESPSERDLENARAEIDVQLNRVAPIGRLDHHYGTAGTFTHLVSLELGLSSYRAEKVNGQGLTLEKVKSWLARLAPMSNEERKKLPGVDPRRVDLLVPGTLIIERLHNKFGNPRFEVHDRGVRYGKLFEQLRGFNSPIQFHPDSYT